jgi:hypothetical protein
MGSALFEGLDTTFGLPLVTVQVCWNCQYLQAVTGRYSSKGPKCGECGEYLDTYKLLEDNDG